MQKSVVIDYLPENARRYRSGWAIVAVDVIRATTTAITAAAAGWRCFNAATIEDAFAIARELDNPLVAGESRGELPAGFEMNNSPSELMLRTDNHRPLVLVSSSGTRLIHLAAGCEAVYLACFRNYSALADYLAGRHSRVAIVGAGSRNEFREEDQICCAWIAARLMNKDYVPKDQTTLEIVRRWQNAPPKACLSSHSVDYLMRTGQLKDLDFILNHVDDLRDVFTVRDGVVEMIPQGQTAQPVAAPADLHGFTEAAIMEA
jgi:2-phosphosulfolactate phosphatase